MVCGGDDLNFQILGSCFIPHTLVLPVTMLTGPKRGLTFHSCTLGREEGRERAVFRENSESLRHTPKRREGEALAADPFPPPGISRGQPPSLATLPNSPTLGGGGRSVGAISKVASSHASNVLLTKRPAPQPGSGLQPPQPAAPPLERGIRKEAGEAGRGQTWEANSQPQTQAAPNPSFWGW